VEAGALARWSRNLGQKKHEGVRSNSTKGIVEWPGSTAASRRQAAVVLTSMGRKKWQRGGYFPPAIAFIGGERGVLGGAPGLAKDACVEPDR
jgi:hypothetical protein